MAGGIFGPKTKKDPMRQSSAMTTVYLLQQNQKFEQFMKAKVDDLETRVAAQQARISAKEEQAEKEIWADLDRLDDLFVDVPDPLQNPTPTPSKQVAPVSVSAGQHPAASLGVRDGGPRQPEVNNLTPTEPDDLREKHEIPGGGGDDDTPVDILTLMMGNEGGGGDEIVPDNDLREETDRAPTVATPPKKPPTPVTAMASATAILPAPATVAPQPPPVPPAGTFNVASEYEPLFANRFSTPAPVKRAGAVEPTRPMQPIQPVQPVQPPPALVEPTRPVQLSTATGVASPGKQGEETATLPAEWDTNLDEKADQGAGDLPDWNISLPDEVEGE